jgi:hypothetical protein
MKVTVKWRQFPETMLPGSDCREINASWICGEISQKRVLVNPPVRPRREDYSDCDCSSQCRQQAYADPAQNRYERDFDAWERRWIAWQQEYGATAVAPATFGLHTVFLNKLSFQAKFPLEEFQCVFPGMTVLLCEKDEPTSFGTHYRREMDILPGEQTTTPEMLLAWWFAVTMQRALLRTAKLRDTTVTGLLRADDSRASLNYVPIWNALRAGFPRDEVYVAILCALGPSTIYANHVSDIDTFIKEHSVE